MVVDPRPFLGRPSLADWRTYCQLLGDAVAARHVDLLVVDTWSQLTPSHQENDAREVTEAFLPLRQITDKGGAVLVCHHAGKGDATEGKASRGSGALPAAVDIIIEMRRSSPGDPQDTCRNFRCYGRYDDIPPSFSLQLTPDGYQTVTVMRGPKLTKTTEATAWLASLLAAGPKAANEIFELGNAAGFSERTLNRAKVDVQAVALQSGRQWFWRLQDETFRF